MHGQVKGTTCMKDPFVGRVLENYQDSSGRAEKEDKHPDLCPLHTPPPYLHVITLNRRASQVHGYDWRDTVINKVTDTMATGEAKWNASSYCKGQNLLYIYSSERLCSLSRAFLHKHFRLHMKQAGLPPQQPWFSHRMYVYFCPCLWVSVCSCVQLYKVWLCLCLGRGILGYIQTSYNCEIVKCMNVGSVRDYNFQRWQQYFISSCLPTSRPWCSCWLGSLGALVIASSKDVVNVVLCGLCGFIKDQTSSVGFSWDIQSTGSQTLGRKASGSEATPLGSPLIATLIQSTSWA